MNFRPRGRRGIFAAAFPTDPSKGRAAYANDLNIPFSLMSLQNVNGCQRPFDRSGARATRGDGRGGRGAVAEDAAVPLRAPTLRRHRDEGPLFSLHPLLPSPSVWGTSPKRAGRRVPPLILFSWLGTPLPFPERGAQSPKTKPKPGRGRSAGDAGHRKALPCPPPPPVALRARRGRPRRLPDTRRLWERRAGGRRLPAPHRAHPAPRAARGSKSQTIEERREEGNRRSLTRPLSPLRGPNRGSGAVLSAGAAPDFPPARSGPVVASLGRRRTGDGGGQRGVSVRGPSRGGPSPAGSEGAALPPPPPQCRSSAAVEGRSVKPGRRESPRHKKATDGPWCSFNTFYYSSVRITLQTYHEKG